MGTVVRYASHSGTWYSSNPLKLSKQLDGFLKAAPSTVPGARFLIGPHAGYSYAGATLAETYGVWDTTNVKRVFILGPSHHVYFNNVAYVSNVDQYETPFGNIPVDKEVIADLLSKDDLFKAMSIEDDENEHSFEMHAPYIYKLSENSNSGIPKIIPIMISHSDEKFMKKISLILSEYLKDEENTFVVSSDFCHWGSRFRYTAYTPTGSLNDLKSLKLSSKIPTGNTDSLSISKSIEYLDKLATKVASGGSSKEWSEYINKTGNTICGQKPIGVLLQAIELIRDGQDKGKDWAKFEWIGYAQSSTAKTPGDSSVSYASGYAVS